MIDYHSNLVSALKTIGIPVHYEMTLHSGLRHLALAIWSYLT